MGLGRGTLISAAVILAVAAAACGGKEVAPAVAPASPPPSAAAPAQAQPPATPPAVERRTYNVDGRPSAITYDPDRQRVFVAVEKPNQLVEIDMATGKVSVVREFGNDAPVSLSSDGSGLWVAVHNQSGDRVMRIRHSGYEIECSAFTGPGPFILASDMKGGALVGNTGVGGIDNVVGISRSCGLTSKLNVGDGPHYAASVGQNTWISLSDSNAVQVTGLPGLMLTIPVGKSPQGIAYAGGHVFVANSGSGTLTKIKVNHNSLNLETIALGGQPWDVLTDGQSVFVTNRLQNSVLRISPETARVLDVYQLPGTPTGMTSDGYNLLVTIFEEGRNGYIMTIPNATKGLISPQAPAPPATTPSSKIVARPKTGPHMQLNQHMYGNGGALRPKYAQRKLTL